MFRRAGVNLLKKVLEGKRWIDAFPVGTVVSPVLMTDDHYFTGTVIEVQPKINKVFVSWDGGSQPTQHDPDELEPIYPCTAPDGVSHATKTASARRMAYGKGFVKNLPNGCKLIDVGDRFVVTNRNGLNIGECRTEIEAESIAEEYEYPSGGNKTASVKNASMSDYEYQCATAIRNALVEEHAAVAIYEEMAQFAQDGNMKTVAESLAEEEKVHIGELTALLNRYNGNELETMAEGVAENDEQLNPTTTPAVEIGADIPSGPLAPVPEDVVVVGIDDSPVEAVVEATPVETVVEAIPVETVVDAVPVETVKPEPPAIIQLLASAKIRTASKYKDCKICEFGKIIRDNYAKMPMEAEIFVDYFDGMEDLDTRIGNYDGIDVIKGFLENSADWNSPTGKAVKSELERRVKEFEKDIPKPLLDEEKKTK